MTAAIAVAGEPPMRPVAGAMTAPIANCSAPSRAAALPARCGFASSAMAGADGMTSPAVLSVSTSRTVTGSSPPPATVTTRRADASTTPAETAT